MDGSGLVPVLQKTGRFIDKFAVSPVTRLSKLAHSL